MPRLALRANGREVAAEIGHTDLLVDLLRCDLGLTGTHVGCDTAPCGACTVLLDGRPVKSCSLLALQAQGSAVTIVEGLAGHPPPDEAAIVQALEGNLCRCTGYVNIVAAVQKAARTMAGEA